MVTIPASDRSVSYSPVNSAGPFPVPFPLFDGTGADLLVSLDGGTVAGWTFSGEEESGFYGSPGTWINGSITFAAPVSGVLVIEGKRAPRRPNQFAEGRGVPARDINTELNIQTATAQEARRDIDKMLSAVDRAEDARDRAEGAAVDAEQSLTTMQSYILGSGPVFPAVDARGNPVVDYARFILTGQPDPADDGEYYRLAPGWERIPGLPPGSFRRTGHVFVTSGMAASGIVPISTGYVPTYVDVFRNGARQLVGAGGTGTLDPDCEAGDGLTIQFPPGALVADDVIEWVASHPRAVDAMEAVDVLFTSTPEVPQANVQEAVAALGTAVDDRPTSAQMDAAIAAGLAAANAGGTVLVSSGGAGGAVSSITIPLTGGYRQYRLIVDMIEPVTADASLGARFSFDGGSSFASGASDYAYAGSFESPTLTPAAVSLAGAAAFYLSNSMSVASGKVSFVDLDISLPDSPGARFSGVKWHAVYRSGASGHLVSLTAGGAPLASSDRPSHVRLFFSSGNIAAGARWQLYGNRN